MAMMFIIMVMMVVMAHRRLADGVGKSWQLHPVLAQLAIHVRLAVHCLVGPLRKYFHQERMHI